MRPQTAIRPFGNIKENAPPAINDLMVPELPIGPKSAMQRSL